MSVFTNELGKKIMDIAMKENDDNVSEHNSESELNLNEDDDRATFDSVSSETSESNIQHTIPHETQFDNIDEHKKHSVCIQPNVTGNLIYTNDDSINHGVCIGEPTKLNNDCPDVNKDSQIVPKRKSLETDEKLRLIKPEASVQPNINDNSIPDKTKKRDPIYNENNKTTHMQQTFDTSGAILLDYGGIGISRDINLDDLLKHNSDKITHIPQKQQKSQNIVPPMNVQQQLIRKPVVQKKVKFAQPINMQPQQVVNIAQTTLQHVKKSFNLPMSTIYFMLALLCAGIGIYIYNKSSTTNTKPDNE